MYSKEALVKNPAGLHARPASELCEFCQKFECGLRIYYNDMVVEPRSIISILCAAIGSGSTVLVEGNGDGEQAAVDSIVEFIENLEE